MWYTSSNQTALQSSVNGDLDLESIFLTTLRAQEWAQCGLNSCGLLQGWSEIPLLYNSGTDRLYLYRLFIRPNAHLDRVSTRALCQWVSRFCRGHLHDWRGKPCSSIRIVERKSFFIVVMEYCPTIRQCFLCKNPYGKRQHCIIMVVTKLPCHF